MPYINQPTTASGTAGREIGYDQITASVNVASATEATGTTVITCAAHAFDGALVLAQFFAPAARPDTTAAGHTLTLCLFESTTEICRLGLVEGAVAGTATFYPVVGQFRFTPTAASHTYTVTGFVDAGTGQVIAGVGGATAYPPAFIRFTKV